MHGIESGDESCAARFLLSTWRLITLGRLSRATNHEINNLSTILFGLEDLLRDAVEEGSPAAREDCAALGEIGARLNALVSHARALQKMECTLEGECSLTETAHFVDRLLESQGIPRHGGIPAALSSLELRLRLPRLVLTLTWLNLVLGLRHGDESVSGEDLKVSVSGSGEGMIRLLFQSPHLPRNLDEQMRLLVPEDCDPRWARHLARYLLAPLGIRQVREDGRLSLFLPMSSPSERLPRSSLR